MGIVDFLSNLGGMDTALAVMEEHFTNEDIHVKKLEFEILKKLEEISNRLDTIQCQINED